MNDLTLEKAFEMARQAESQTKEGKKMRQETTEATTEVNRVPQTGRNLRKFKQEDSKNTSLQERRTCGHERHRCGYPNHIQGRKYLALKSMCRRCKKEGHWDRMCKSKGVRRIK